MGGCREERGGSWRLDNDNVCAGLGECAHDRTLLGEVEQRRQLAAVGQTLRALTQLVEERMGARLQRCHAGTGRVLEQSRNQCDRVWRRARAEHLLFLLRKRCNVQMR